MVLVYAGADWEEPEHTQDYTGNTGVLKKGAAKSGAVGMPGLEQLMAEASMWISRCQVVMVDVRNLPPGSGQEPRKQVQAALMVLADLRQAVVVAEKEIRAALTSVRRHSPG